MSEREMRDLIAKLERQLGVDWARIVEWLRESNPVDAIENRYRELGIAGDLVKETQAAAERFAASVNEASAASGRAAAKWLDRKVADSLISYNATNHRAVAQAQQNRYQFVREISDEQRAVVRRAVSDGVLRGDNPRVIARDIRESIGLTEIQSGHVSSYRRALESGDWDNALGRQLSDARSDRTIRRIRSSRGVLTGEQVDVMTERYRKNYVTFRAETIARTEALRAANDGTRELFKQAVERSDILASELETTWCAGPATKHARDSHQHLDNKSVAYGEDFKLPGGVRMTGPGDPRGGVKNNANCRCTTSTTYTEEAAVPVPVAVKAPQPVPAVPVVPPEPVAPIVVTERKNEKRVAAARKAAEASVERRREIHSAARSNLPQELHVVWDKEGHKFMQEEAGRIRGVKDRVNASSTLSQAFAEKYGSGDASVFGNEGDRFYMRTEIEAKHAESWADEQERKYYAAAKEAAHHDDEPATFTPSKASDDDPPF